MVDKSDIFKIEDRMRFNRVIPSKRKRYNSPISDYLLSFDIETTNWDENNATMYDWTLGGATYKELVNCNCNDDLIKVVDTVFGRTWEDLDFTLNFLNDTAEQLATRYIILIYNFAFEWSFMQKNIDFCRETYKPEYPSVIEGNHSIMSLACGNLIFLDATRLFGLGSLRQNAAKYGFQKLEYDYDLPRHSKTPLTDEEIIYNKNDVLITLGAWAHCLNNNGIECIDEAPFTSTSMIKYVLQHNEHVNEVCKVYDYKHKVRNKFYKSKGKVTCFEEAKKIASNVFPKNVDIEEIARFLEQSFSGGYTHCNCFAQGNTYYNVGSADLKSAYPGAMEAPWYPRKLSKSDNPKNLFGIMKRLKNMYKTPLELAAGTRKPLEYFAVCRVVLTDICVKKQEQELVLPLISKHKLLRIGEGAQFDNGKLVECSEIEIVCTTIDLMTWNFCYDYKLKDCLELYIGDDIQKLPQYWLNAVEYCYQAKTILKNTIKAYTSNKDWETEYRKLKGIGDTEINHVKGMNDEEAIYYLNMVLLQRKGELNGLYGIMVMHIIRRQYQYNSDKDIIEVDNDIRKSKDGTCYLWGIIVTAIVRLWEVCISIFMAQKGVKPIYWDTDSVKIVYPEDVNIKDYISEFNNYCGPLAEFDPAIGTYDYEGTYYAFKSLGSKRYVVCEKGKSGELQFEATIAGLPKKVFSNFMTQEFNENKKHFSVKKAVGYTMELFRPNIYVDESATSKLIPKYQSEPKLMNMEVTDYLGNKTTEVFWPGARLSGIKFAIMSMDSLDNRLYQLFCDKMQDRQLAEEVFPCIVYYNKKEGVYCVKDGKLDVPIFKTYMMQQDVTLYN